MPDFAYTAYSADGALVRGAVDAPTEAAAFSILRDRRLVPVEIAPAVATDAAATPAGAAASSARGERFNRPFLARFTRMMASLLASKVPLVDAIELARENERPGRWRTALDRVRESILNGASLSEALQRVGGLAPAYYLSMVVAGERSGALAVVLGDLAEQIEREQTIRSRIRSGLLYPAILFTTSLAVLAVIATILVPAITPLFENSGAELPAAISLVNGTRDLFAEHGVAILAGVLAALLILLRVRRIAAVRRAMERAAFSLPLAGAMKANIEAAHFTATLGIMLRNGVSLVQSLEATLGALRTEAFRDTVREAIASLREGGRLSDTIDAAPHVPLLARRMIRIGEETGSLPTMLDHVARTLDAEAQRQVVLVFQLVPPVMTLLIGLGVGSFILVIMDAVLGVNDLAF